MAANGGTFEVYYFKHKVTHIICSNLPNAKIKALEKERYALSYCRMKSRLQLILQANC